jgi:hypothetical protein
VLSYVTIEALTALLGGGDPARVQIAVDAANQLIGHWVEPADPDNPPTEPTAAQQQAGLELAQTLYRRHAATGGFVGVDDLLARLPADLTRGIRDLLDTDTKWWGIA